MHKLNPRTNGRPRELRRRVLLPARLRTGVQWSDACILNISSRGLLIHSPRPPSKGSVVELRRGDHMIVARVMWRDGARFGLRSEERVPIEDILSSDQSQALRLTAVKGAVVERRKAPRQPAVDARLRGRAVEFLGLGVAAVSLSLVLWGMAQQALARPMQVVVTALGG